jgi:signal peptidase I
MIMAKHSKPKNNASKAESRTSSKSKSLTTPKTLGIAVASLLLLAVLVFAGVAALALVRGTWQVNSVVSASMRPGLSVGDMAISERVPVDQLALRDVIVFKNPDNSADLEVRRIVRLTKNRAGLLVIKTQGDANNVEDPWTLTIRGDYAFEVRSSVPLIGYITIYYQDYIDVIVLVLGSVIVLLAIAVGVIYRRRKRDDTQGETPEKSRVDVSRVNPGFKLGAHRDKVPVINPEESSPELPTLFDGPPVVVPTSLPSNEPEIRTPVIRRTVVVTRPIDQASFGIDEDRID